MINQQTQELVFRDSLLKKFKKSKFKKSSEIKLHWFIDQFGHETNGWANRWWGEWNEIADHELTRRARTEWTRIKHELSETRIKWTWISWARIRGIRETRNKGTWIKWGARIKHELAECESKSKKSKNKRIQEAGFSWLFSLNNYMKKHQERKWWFGIKHV